MEVPAAVTVASLMTQIGSVFTAAMGWAGKVGETIVGNPLLLLVAVGVPLCGLGVGLFKRLLSTRG